jgi:ribonuclease P protein component
MINRKHRFHGLGSLSKVYRNGKSIRGTNISLNYWLNPRRESFRLAVVVSKKTSKSAVTRNRIRRRVFESSRTLSGYLEKPYDLVISVFDDSFADMPADQLSGHIKKLLEKLPG